MKKISLNELFSKLDLSAEELPELHKDYEVSYRNVQKKVLSKIKCSEVMEVDVPERSKKNRIIFCLAAAAALAIGGMGAYGASNAAKNVCDEQIMTSDRSVTMEIKTDNDILNNSDATAEDLPAFEHCSKIYEYSINNNMDGFTVDGVRYWQDGNDIWFIVHITADDQENVSMLDVNFGNYSSVSALYGAVSQIKCMITSETDDKNLYAAFGFENTSLDFTKNKFVLNLNNIFRKDCEQITSLGMKNLLGFTNKEIAENKEITDDMIKQLDNDYICIDNCYYKKEDVISVGNISITADPSEESFDVNEDIIPASIGIFSGDTPSYEESDNMKAINADVIGVQNTGRLTEVLICFYPEDGYILEPDSNFDIKSISVYTQDSKTKLKNYINDTLIRCDSKYSEEKSGYYKNKPCIYYKIELQTMETDDLYLDVIYGDSETKADYFTENSIRLYIPLGKTGVIKDETAYVFSTGDDFDIRLSMSSNEVRMDWISREDHCFPEFFDEYIMYDSDESVCNIIQADAFTFVMNDGQRYDVRMNFIVNEDNSVNAAGFFYNNLYSADDVTGIYYGDYEIFFLL